MAAGRPPITRSLEYFHSRLNEFSFKVLREEDEVKVDHNMYVLRMTEGVPTLFYYSPRTKEHCLDLRNAEISAEMSDEELREKVKTIIQKHIQKELTPDVQSLSNEFQAEIKRAFKELGLENLCSMQAIAILLQGNTLEEMIGNAIDSKATKFYISINILADKIICRIQDDGCGFSEIYLARDKSRTSSFAPANARNIYNTAFVSDKKEGDRGKKGKGLRMQIFSLAHRYCDWMLFPGRGARIEISSPWVRPVLEVKEYDAPRLFLPMFMRPVSPSISSPPSPVSASRSSPISESDGSDSPMSMLEGDDGCDTPKASF